TDEQQWGVRTMGLLDILNGMQNGPRGAAQPDKGGMSPITMAILGLLAYKAFKKISGNNTAPTGRQPLPAPQQTPSADTGLGGLLGGGGLGGGLGSVLAGGLGGLLSGGAAGSIL